MLSFGERLRLSRENKGLKQKDVCNYINLSNKSLSRYETDKSSPDPEMILKLAKLYNVSLDFLFGVSDELNTSKEQQKAAFSIDEQNLVRDYRELSTEQKKMISVQIHSVAESNRQSL